MPKKPKIPEAVMKYFRATGAEGGRARAKKHTKEQLSQWAKMGGRPKSANKEPKGKG